MDGQLEDRQTVCNMRPPSQGRITMDIYVVYKSKILEIYNSR